MVEQNKNYPITMFQINAENNDLNRMYQMCVTFLYLEQYENERLKISKFNLALLVTCSQNCIKLERQQAKTPYFKSKFIVFVFFGFKHFGCQSKNLFFSFISNRFFQKCHHSKSFDLLVFAKCTLKIKHYENHRIQNMLLSS